MILYLIFVSFIWAVFILAFHFFYKNTSYFSINRIYILTTIVAGLIIPLIPNPFGQNNLFETTSNLNFKLQEITIYSTDNYSTFRFKFSILIWSAYLILVSISAIKFFISIRTILKLISLESEKIDNIYIVHLKEEHIPFSFFRTIVIPIRYIGESSYQLILKHEKEHINQGHYWDILFINVLLIIIPFHPFLYWYRKELKLIHEFQADACILKTYSKKEYASILLQISQDSFLKCSMIHSITSSPLKSRIMMFYKKSTPFQTLSYFLIPLFFVLCFTCSPKNKISSNSRVLKYSIVDTMSVFDTETKKESVFVVQDEIEYYTGVDRMPEFPGGNEALMKFIEANLKYPEEMKKIRKEGTTVVSLIVKEDGSILIKKFLKSITPEFNSEVTDMIKLMPKWNPGLLNGKKVNTEVTLPIKFKL